MPVAYFSETPTATNEQFGQVGQTVAAQLGGPNVRPEGMLYHALGPLENGGWWLFYHFDSAEHFERFHDAILAPAVAQAGHAPIAFRRLEVAWDSLGMESRDAG
jgi:hypothetical protein